MSITLGCDHSVEVEYDLPEEQIHYMEHMGLCSECWTKVKEREAKASHEGGK